MMEDYYNVILGALETMTDNNKRLLDIQNCILLSITQVVHAASVVPIFVETIEREVPNMELDQEGWPTTWQTLDKFDIPPIGFWIEKLRTQELPFVEVAFETPEHRHNVMHELSLGIQSALL